MCRYWSSKRIPFLWNPELSTMAHSRNVAWTSWIQFTSSQPISLNSIWMLSSSCLYVLNCLIWKIQVMKLHIILCSLFFHLSICFTPAIISILLFIQLISPFLSKCRTVWFWHFDWLSPETMAARSESFSIPWLWLTSGCQSQISNVGWSPDSSWFTYCRSNASSCQWNSPTSKSTRYSEET